MIKIRFKTVKKIVVGIIGFSVLFVGILMIVFPGPAFIVIPLALIILASEFLWAKRWLDKLKSRANKVKKKVTG